MQNLVIVLLHKRQLEPIFRRFDGNGAHFAVPVKDVEALPLHFGQVYGLFDRTDNAVVAARQRVSIVLSQIVSGLIRTYPFGKAYLMWFKVEYTKMPISSHAPLLILMVSWIVQLWSSCLDAMTITIRRTSAQPSAMTKKSSILFTYHAC